MAITLALAAFVLAVLLHGLAMRARMRLDSVRRFLMVGIPLGLGLAAFSLGRFGLTLPGFAAILLYAMLCELYMFCFTLVISSISATMLILLRQGPMQGSALASVYHPRQMVELRFDRLLKTDFIAKASGRFSVTRKGERLHRIFSRLRKFFGHEGDLKARRLQQDGDTPAQGRRWSRAVSVLILAGLVLTPIILVAIKGATLSGMYEESIGYRYFYSLRTVLGEHAVLFLPQGQIQDLLSQAIQIVLNVVGYPPYDITGRIDAFSYILVACAMLLALSAFWFGDAERGEGPITCLFAAALWGSVFYLPGYNTVYSLLQPDYYPFILAIAIGANALIGRLALGATVSPVRDAVVFGMFFGLCLATKVSLAVFAATSMIVYLIERPRLRSLLILASAGLIGIGMWLATIKLDYRVSGTTLKDYFVHLASFIQTSGGMPKQTVGIFKWGLAKLSPDSYLHGALVLLPALVALVFFSCRLARRSVLAAVFVASLAYCHVLHGRDYPGTNLEIAVFVCFVFLCLWRELNRQFSEGLGKWVTGGASIAVITFALISDIAYFRSTVLSIMGSAVANTAAQSRLRADMSVLPKPMLWPVPSNSERTLTVYSAIMKGSSSVEMHGRSVESETMRAISPDLDFVGGPVLQRTRRNVGDYNTIIFATAEATDEPGIAAMQRIYNFDFRGFSCGQLADMPYQRIIACKRELVARTLPN